MTCRRVKNNKGEVKKNHEWLCAAFASQNIYMHRKRLARLAAKVNLEVVPLGA